jgi:EAL and modified HD-GYP domain-containing signal transduction protein
MIIKRPVYNHLLECVGIELIAHKNAIEYDKIFEYFDSILRNTEKHLPLFIPYALKFLVEKPDSPIENPIILKLHAADIDHLCPREELEQSNYTIALLIDNPEQLAWLNFAKYIALSEHLMIAANVTKVVKYSHEHQRKVIAYGINHLSHFERSRDMSMDLYCGDFLFQPREQESQAIAANQFNLLEIISKLQQRDTNLDLIAEMIQADPMLSYQLLRVANSVAFSGYQSVESIQQAIMRLGIINLKNWIMVLSMTNVSNKPMEIVESGLIRAQMAQKIAESQTELNAESAYTVGLLSVLDSLMDTPMEHLIENITLADEIKSALVSHTGNLGELLSAVIAYEEGHLDNDKETIYLNCDLSKIYLECLEQITLSKKAMSAQN